MSTTTSKIGNKIQAKLGLPRVPRRPLREKISALRAEALRMPANLSVALKGKQTVSVADVLVELNEAKAKIWEKVASNDDRRKSVTATEIILKTAEPNMVELRKAGGTPQTVTLEVPVATQQTAANAEKLLKPLELLRKMITQSQGTLTAFALPRDRTYNALIAEAEGLRLRINETIVQDKLVKTFTDELKNLRDKFDAATKLAGQGQTDKERLEQKAEEFTQKLAPLAKILKAAGQDLASGPSQELRELDNLTRQLTGRPLDVEAADGLALKIAGMVDDALKKDPKVYAKQLIDDAAAAKNRDEERQYFSDRVTPRLTQLVALAQAVGGDASELERAYRDTLAIIGVPDQAGKIPDTKKLGTDLFHLIVEAIEKQDKALDGLRQTIEQLGKDVVKKVETVRKLMGKLDVLAVDWKQIDGVMASFKQQVEGTGKPTVESASALSAAKVIGEQLLARVQKLAENGKAYADFASTTSTLTSELKNNKVAGEKSSLGAYFPDERGKLSAELKRILKDQATQPGAKSVADLAALKLLYDAKLKDANELGKVAKDAKELLAAKTKIYEKITGNWLSRKLDLKTHEPNKASQAMDALKQVLGQTPASKDAILAAQKALDEALTLKTTADELTQSHVQAEVAENEAKEKKKQVQEELAVRYREAKAGYMDAKAAVEQVNGDKLALEAIDTILEQAKTQMKAGDKGGAERSFERVMQRVDLLLAHPEGEANRSRKLLANLFKEWQSVLSTTGGYLQTTIDTIESYQPPDTTQDINKAKAGLARLGAQLQQYKAAFIEHDVKALATALGQLASDDLPETGRRKARERALAIINDQSSDLQQHPLTTLLASCPLPGASSIGGHLLTGLARLQFTVITSVR